MEPVEYEAIYEDGVFKPVHSVGLPEHTRVVVRVSTESGAAEREAAKKRMFESLARSYDTGQSDIAARHNEHQP